MYGWPCCQPDQPSLGSARNQLGPQATLGWDKRRRRGIHDGLAAAGNLDPQPAVPAGKGFTKVAQSREDGGDVGRDR